MVPHFDVASNPEFLQEGRAVENFFQPDRIVIGVESARAQELLEAIYRPLKCPIVVTNLTTSELIKHAANAFLSTKISFINMVSDICEAVGADVVNVARGIGLDPESVPAFSMLASVSAATAFRRTCGLLPIWAKSTVQTAPCCGKSNESMRGGLIFF